MAKLKKLTTPRPSPTGLHPRWQATLARLEDRVLALANEVADALERAGEKNLFELIAATNALLDLLDRLHQRAENIRLHTDRALDTTGWTPATKHPLEVPEHFLLGTNEHPH